MRSRARQRSAGTPASGQRPRGAAARAAAALAAVLVPLTAMPAPAAAESVPAPHIQDYGLDWVSRVDAARWPAPADRPAVCIVDSGVAVTPDTPATSPDGPIIARLAVDGGSGEPQGTTDGHLHGTQMAAQIVAPQNGWGIVGVWPQGRLISVRATIGTSVGYNSGAYITGAKTCMNWALDNNVKLGVINLSLGSASGGEAEGLRVQDLTVQAHARGINVVASGGNNAGQPTPYPARGDGVLSVGAGSTPPGSWCSYATHDSLTDLVGPACPTVAPYLPTGDEVSYNEGGSSTAAAVTSGFLAALRTLSPAATWNQAELWLTAGSQSLETSKIIDGNAAARGAGVGDLVTTVPRAASPVTGQSAGGGPALSPVVVDDHATNRPRLPRPSLIRATWRSGRLIVTTAAKVPGARLKIEIRVGKRVRTARAPRGRSWVSIRAPRTISKVKVSWKSTDEFTGDSRSKTLSRPRHGWPRR